MTTPKDGGPPKVFTHGINKIMDTSTPTKPDGPKKEATGTPDHELRMPGPGGDSVITQNMHKQHTASPPSTPAKDPPKLPKHEHALEISGNRGRPGYAGTSFRQATRPNGRPR